MRRAFASCIVLFLQYGPLVWSFLPAHPGSTSIRAQSFTLPSIIATQLSASSIPISPEATTLKQDLLFAIKDLRSKQERDGEFSIDFGVKGGELDKKSRAPQKVSYYSVSEDVGKAADKVMSICQELSRISPLEEPTKYLGDPVNGNLAPLNGAWKLLFTTAADASFSKNSTRGDAKAQNVVDACKGKITNVIDFLPGDDKKEPALKQLNVIIKATAESPTRVGLQFRYAKAVCTKFFVIPFRWSLYIPVPAAFITRCIVLFSRLWKFGGKAPIKAPPKAFFDILYLDGDLRVHKTGEDNLFVQAKDSWTDAKPYLK